MHTPNMGKSGPSSLTVCKAMPESSGRPVQHDDPVHQKGKLEDGLFEADALVAKGSGPTTSRNRGCSQQCRMG